MSAAEGLLDLREQIARIDRAQEEVRKFSAETRKLTAEAEKLYAEASKLGRDRWLAPVIVTFSGLAALGGLVAAIASLHLWGLK